MACISFIVQFTSWYALRLMFLLIMMGKDSSSASGIARQPKQEDIYTNMPTNYNKNYLSIHYI